MIFPRWTPTAFQYHINSYIEFISDSRSSEHPDIKGLRRKGEMFVVV